VFNDANLACNAELAFGAGSDLSDFAYFFVGSFIGGGIVLRGQVFYGANQNAGALGSIPVGPTGDPNHQLIHHASLYTLERMLSAKSGHPVNFRSDPSVWNGYPDLVDSWIDQTAHAIAQAAVSVIAVLDVSTIVVDGGFPPSVRSRLAQQIATALPSIDQQGLRPFRVIEGRLGRSAGALGAAYVPLQKTYFLEGRSPN
ncbi:MAG: ROK family protein, partial [Pseudomonadota bacterium]